MRFLKSFFKKYPKLDIYEYIDDIKGRIWELCFRRFSNPIQGFNPSDNSSYFTLDIIGENSKIIDSITNDDILESYYRRICLRYNSMIIIGERERRGMFGNRENVVVIFVKNVDKYLIDIHGTVDEDIKHLLTYRMLKGELKCEGILLFKKN